MKIKIQFNTGRESIQWLKIVAWSSTVNSYSVIREKHKEKHAR